MVQYRSLEDIRIKKDELKQLKEKRMLICHVRWETLVSKDDEKMTPTQNLFNNAHKAAAVFDGIRAGVKLYNKFKKNNKNNTDNTKKKRFFGLF